MSIFMSVFVYLSICLSVCLSIYLSMSYIQLRPSVCWCVLVCLGFYLNSYPYIHQSIIIYTKGITLRFFCFFILQEIHEDDLDSDHVAGGTWAYLPAAHILKLPVSG